MSKALMLIISILIIWVLIGLILLIFMGMFKWVDYCLYRFENPFIGFMISVAPLVVISSLFAWMVIYA